MITRLVYLDNASTSLKTDRFIEDLCISYESTDWIFRKKETLSALLNILSEMFHVENKNIALVPSSTYAINEIWEYIFKIKKFTNFRIFIQKEEHISNVSSLNYLRENMDAGCCTLEYFSAEHIHTLNLEPNDVILISLTDNLGEHVYSKKEIESLRERNLQSIIIGDFTQYMPNWDEERNFSNLFDFFYFSAHKCGGPLGLGIIVSKSKKLIQKILSRRNYSLDWRSIYMYEKALQEKKKLNIVEIQEKQNKLKNFWMTNFPKHPKLKYTCSSMSLIFLVGFNSEYLHDLLYFLESNNIIFRAYDLCNNSSAITKRQIRFSLSYLNTIDDLKILFNALQHFFELKLI